ncbi:hypothetical protein D3C81_1660340 [compost metagenome]
MTRAAVGACRALARPASSIVGNSTELRHGTISTSNNPSSASALSSTRGPCACSRRLHHWRHSRMIGRKMNHTSSTSIRKIPNTLKNR